MEYLACTDLSVSKPPTNFVTIFIRESKLLDNNVTVNIIISKLNLKPVFNLFLQIIHTISSVLLFDLLQYMVYRTTWYGSNFEINTNLLLPHVILLTQCVGLYNFGDIRIRI